MLSVGISRQPLYAMSHLVSVIIPTHNRAQWLRPAIESVLAQTYPNLELIVVDDGSTDETAALLASYGSRLCTLHQNNCGVSVARNSGFAHSHGDYVCFLDDDDIFLPEKIALQVAGLDAEPNAVLVHCGHHLMDEQGRRLRHTGLLPAGDVLAQLSISNFVWMGAPLIRRTALQEVGLFDTQFSTAADYDLWLRLARRGPFACVHKILGGYRVHPESMVSDPTRTEHDVMHVHQKFFAQPQLPADVLQHRFTGEAMWRLWFAERYLAARDIGAAQRNWLMAYACAPQLLHNHAAMAMRFAAAALDHRTRDSLTYLDCLFNQLPPPLTFLRAIQLEVLQLTLLGMAMIQYSAGNFDRAAAVLAQAIGRFPNLARDPQLFLRMAYDTAMTVWCGPEQFVEDVYTHLPTVAKPLQQTQRLLLADLQTWRGFNYYFVNQPELAISCILRGVQQRPRWLRNRGLMSVLVRSSWQALRKQFNP